MASDPRNLGNLYNTIREVMTESTKKLTEETVSVDSTKSDIGVMDNASAANAAPKEPEAPVEKEEKEEEKAEEKKAKSDLKDYEKKSEDIVKLVDYIKKALTEHAKKAKVILADEEEKDRGFLSDLVKVRADLINVIGFLNNKNYCDVKNVDTIIK